MNETMTSDRLAELTMLELLDEMNSRLSAVRVMAETSALAAEAATTMGDKLAVVSLFTNYATPMLEEVQTLMGEYNKRLSN